MRVRELVNFIQMMFSYYYFDTSAGGLLVHVFIIRQVVNTYDTDLFYWNL